jgi:NADH:ubiquinone oxidoreductase subunit 6 (subunit J)
MPIGNSIPIVGIRWDDMLFIVLAAALLVSALLVVTLRDIIRCGLALTAAFASLAGIYALLGDPLVAATQVLVYIGAISVLILFAIIVTQTKNAPMGLAFQTQAWIGAAAAVVIAVVISGTILATTWPAGGQRLLTGTVDVAHKLFSDYVLPFEVVSVLLTASVVGGVYLARREIGRREIDPRGEDRS